MHFSSSDARRVLFAGCVLSVMATGLLFAQDWAAQEHRQPMEAAVTAFPTVTQTPDAEPRDPEITITLEEFRKLAVEGAVTIVDVRDSKTFATAHIPGALSIPLGTVGRAAEQLRKLGKPIVTYCS
jgi:3-mercaptopyruvate sulfurtransferase SseA